MLICSSVSRCTPFELEVKLSGTSVLVSCKTEKGREVYSNTHSLLERKSDKPNKLKANFAHGEQPPNVFLIGIDSMSRLNFHRVFSNTVNYLQEHDWLEYKGYNKIGDNTFPNLMALLTGKNITTVLKECDPKKHTDTCNFVWEDYSKLGYLTALMEDESSIGTFATYHFKGFRKQPTDLYYMPYVVASEKLLPVKKMEGLTYCAGPQTSVERVLNVIKDLVLNYSDQPKFGVFWMNSVSHEDINAAGRVDEVFTNFLSELEPDINNNTIIIFLSDHGIRFGNIRVTRSGWLEERLPFLYFWIPNEFKRKFPNEYQHLKQNADQLTTPYDIYMMLQHVLALYKVDYSLKNSEGCSNCRSLFTHINDRSCEEASIQFHWCTCFGYNYLNPKSKLALLASHFAINEINTFLDHHPHMSQKCARLMLKSVISAGISVNNSYNKTFVLLIFETNPEAKFEITVSIYNGQKDWRFINEGSTSRLDRYESTSSCVNENKMYCVCYTSFWFYRKIFNTWFEI
ncbi:Protein of unknown function (DUF229) [Popillia japonica]|uniref:Uncharacterized protein n=1 Tax=Popillia japonica TaxID=7064 RepID=A0AAW1IXC6_POPJA